MKSLKNCKVIYLSSEIDKQEKINQGKRGRIKSLHEKTQERGTFLKNNWIDNLL